MHTLDVHTGEDREVFATTELLLEAPNWITPDTLILNGDGVLWRLALLTGDLERIDVAGLPDVNNDHVLSADPDTMFVSGFDWHIHRVDLASHAFVPVTTDEPARPMMHFLHGVSPDGSELAFVGIEPGPHGPFGPANIFTVPSTGGPKRQLTTGTRPADGPEYSPDGEWIYFNTEAFSDAPGHAQIARMRVDGSDGHTAHVRRAGQLVPAPRPTATRSATSRSRPAPPGTPPTSTSSFVSSSTRDWSAPRTVARLFGGQGTLNVNSWAPDSPAFAYVSYPTTPG